MILPTYIFKEMLKSQLVIFLIVLTVFISQSLIRLASRAAVGQIPVDIIAGVTICSIPEVAIIILPLTLFISVLITIGRICSDSEMVVMRSVGFSPFNVLLIAMFLAGIMAVLTAVNSIWLVPLANQQQQEIKNEAANNPQFLPLESGRFLNFNEFNIYIEQVHSQGRDLKDIKHIFVMSSPFVPDDSAVTVASEGHIETDKDGMQWLVLSNGRRYEGPLADGTFRNAEFKRFSAPLVSGSSSLDRNNDSIALMSTKDLMQSDNLRAKVEAQWRIAPIFAILILTMAAVPLSMVNPRQGRFARFIPAILIFTSYYVLLLTARNLILSGTIPLYPGMYAVPIIFLLLISIPLNLPRYRRRRGA